MHKFFIISSAVFGGLSVILGAFAAHGLKNKLDAYAKGVWETAVQYQSVHAISLMVLGFAMVHHANSTWLKVVGWSWSAGIVVFSGSLYLLAVTKTKWLGAITPIGGVALIVGWVALLIFALKDLP